MKNQKTIVKNLIMVLLSNTLILLSSIVVGLIIPKILGVTNYGYYKIFTLYAGYTSLLHFGFLDGILLKHGDKDFNELGSVLKHCFKASSLVIILVKRIEAINHDNPQTLRDY
ncbi:hypothetical protein [Lentilactobacillus buchneri]|uniref:hypothetical protein n=1 Tax=Lentilactobacillus buchneri TaxID=1581 RepID=UPI0011974FCE|nr:hypothetical protein [Lentilactobacillus buchneri]MCT3252080.1 hypothetical protein [Lentilactobacillus buchneri]MCT3546669.1 hypothetical protein [Lentilactobacillus buchneri]MCT4437262.1 hypothetical protein [Lentilactobacillus buchneri]GEP15080.1 hypothetical protein LBU01_22250 [Lentilactobacillus buchneri]